MRIYKNYDINTQLYEFAFIEREGLGSFAYLKVDMPEEDKLNYLVNWLNQCFRAHEETPPEQPPRAD